jgi:hypothetical protein
MMKAVDISICAQGIHGIKNMFFSSSQDPEYSSISINFVLPSSALSEDQLETELPLFILI